MRKNCSSDQEKAFEIRGWRPRIFKNFEITRTIYLNSERSEQFLVTGFFFKAAITSVSIGSEKPPGNS